MTSRFLVVALILVACFVPATGANGNAGPPANKDEFYVYLFGGHSNVFGWDDKHVDLETNPRAWGYRWWKDDKWVLAKEDDDSFFNKGSGGSPAMALLKQLVDVEAWSDVHFGVIQTAAAAATARWKYSAGEGRYRYRLGSELHAQLVTAAKENMDRATIAALVLDLGFEESTNDQATETFDVDLRKTIDELRQSLGMPDLPVFLWEFGTQSEIQKKNPRAPILEAKIKKVASDEARIAYLNPGLTPADYMHNGMGPASHHFNAQGHKKVAAEMVRVMREKGWGTPTTGGCSIGRSDPGARDLDPWLFVLFVFVAAARGRRTRRRRSPTTPA